jgi:hypothetical protein
MTPQQFIEKWKRVALTERATAQEHFLDLCRLFDHPTPAQDDPTGERFTFEKGVPKTGGGEGWADVWKKGFFAWEYKKKKRDLGAAFKQLMEYAVGLESPPLHVACDTNIFRIETRWNNEASARYEFPLEHLDDPRNVEILRCVFHDPDKLRSGRDRARLTEEAAAKFQAISTNLQHRNGDREVVAHFVNQLVFCFFADGVGLLPKGLWHKLLMRAEARPAGAKRDLDALLEMMRTGGEFALEDIAFFNGGPFDGRGALELTGVEVGLLTESRLFNWSLIDPTIFGTLFERFLDPDKRAQIGAHYTDPAKIALIVEPVILRPLRAEWEAAKVEIAAIMAPALASDGAVGPAAKAARGKKFDAAIVKAEARRDAFVDRLCALRILDPACGSGNFLYLALQGVKDIEWRALLDCDIWRLRRPLPRVGPEILRGIEINPFAAELARTTVWIGDIQWRVKNAITHHPRPILRKLDAIECRDALLTPDGKGGFVEAQWPEADYIVGNPPFLGTKKLVGGLGEDEARELRRVYENRVSGFSDLVCWWFEKARQQIVVGLASRAGLVATNSIRGGKNRLVLDAICTDLRIFEAWSDEGWTVNGAAVRVSLVCFAMRDATDAALLNGVPTAAIHPDLTGTLAGVGSNLTVAERLHENLSIGFVGTVKAGNSISTGR